MNNTLMILLEFMVVMAAIFIGAKKGGLGLGIFGGLGLAVLVFVFKLKPQNPPIDVMLMIVAVITAASTLQASGGIDYMVNIAEKLLRAYPPAITIVAPLVSYIFTIIAGTGHIKTRKTFKYFSYCFATSNYGQPHICGYSGFVERYNG